MAAVVGDSFFVCPSRRLAEWMADNGQQVYRSVFSHDPSEDSGFGVFHGVDVAFYFNTRDGQYPGDAALIVNFSAEQRAFIQDIQRYLFNFAYTGNPNGTSTWPLYSSGTRDYLNLDVGNISPVTGGFRSSYCDFWDAQFTFADDFDFPYEPGYYDYDYEQVYEPGYYDYEYQQGYELGYYDEADYQQDYELYDYEVSYDYQQDYEYDSELAYDYDNKTYEEAYEYNISTAEPLQGVHLGLIAAIIILHNAV